MNKTSLIIIIISLVGGVIIENQFDILPNFLNEEDQNIEIRKAPKWRDEFKIVKIKSPIDESLQPAYFYKTKSPDPQPLVVSLHTWSNDYTQYDSINGFSLEKDYNYIHPNFRGVNNTKDACCSDLVISDIDASIDFALENANVDTTRIYVIGMSGGGYATLAMFMKSKHRIKKFSSWVPLVDLVQWYEETKILKLKYSAEILACTESQDGLLNEEIARLKSPIFWETPIKKLNYSTLEISTGIYDGMIGNGVIPITHSINFYNKLLSDLSVTDSTKYVSDRERLRLLEFRKPLGDFGQISGRKVILLKETNNIKLTLFEGGHEILTKYAFEELIK
ncbi:prolyl oligopeptidase family serine peptidase [Algoriphagus sp.]|uniref:alpha/beta hydrolase family protein n=1 Tax=Algoriphagus sp. TaxID=1872435 RepID=UPI0025EA444B|nr:prolyl oligopeptidase family serine peptidase [Algoriphagus sp.]